MSRADDLEFNTRAYKAYCALQDECEALRKALAICRIRCERAEKRIGELLRQQKRGRPEGRP
jgi:hypothetical protein